MSTSELIIDTAPTPDEVQYLEDRLYEFNSTVTGITDGEWLAIFVRDDEHRIVAGICGNTWGGCLEIRQFWVEEARRRQPTDCSHHLHLPGSGLLRQARLRGCGGRGRSPVRS
jgi:hypothetical protein